MRELLQQALRDLVRLADDLRKIPDDIAQTIKALEQELAKPEIPTKLFGPNLEQILNAAGFYKREWVGLTQDEIEEIYTGNTRDNGMCNGLSIAFEVQNKLREKNT